MSLDSVRNGRTTQMWKSSCFDPSYIATFGCLVQSVSNTRTCMFICSAGYISAKNWQKLPQFQLLYHILTYLVSSGMPPNETSPVLARSCSIKSFAVTRPLSSAVQPVVGMFVGWFTHHSRPVNSSHPSGRRRKMRPGDLEIADNHYILFIG